MAKVESINLGLPGKYSCEGGGRIHSAIFKKPVGSKTFLDVLGFEGDGVADSVHHGGADKAVCGYCVDHFPFWERTLDRKFSFGAFGENLSLSALPETQINIGDIFRIGEAEIQCTQPRQPCYKLSKIYSTKEIIPIIKKLGFSGYYFRVLKTGWVESGCEVQLIKADPSRFSVAEANDLLYRNRGVVALIEKLLSITPLSESWRELFQTRLAKNSSSNKIPENIND